MTIHDKLDYIIEKTIVIGNYGNIITLFTKNGQLYTDQALSIGETNITIPSDGDVVLNYTGTRNLNNIPTFTIKLNDVIITPKRLTNITPYIQCILRVQKDDILKFNIYQSYSASSAGYTQYGFNILLLN